MTDAERQARYRAARAVGTPIIRTRRPADAAPGPNMSNRSQFRPRFRVQS